MSGFSYPQPVFSSSIYNPDFYLSLDPNGLLSYSYAQTLYLSKYDYRLTYISGVTPGIATAGVALVLGNDLSLSGIGALSCSSLIVGGSSIDPSLLSDITTIGTFQPSKALTLSSSGVGLMGTGTTSANCFRFYGGTTNKEIVSVFRSSDDYGLTIATKSQSTQKCSPLLHLCSGYETTGVIGTSPADYKEVIRSEHKLVGFGDNYKSGWFKGYMLGTQPWQASGFGFATQFYTSMPALNICCNTSTTTAFAGGSNILMTSDNAFCFNTLSPYNNYQFTVNGDSTRNGIYLTGGSTMLQLYNDQSPNTGRTSIVFSGTNFTQWELSIAGTAHVTVPGCMYWYSSGGTRLVLSPAGRLGVGGVTNPACSLDVGE